MVNQFFFVFVVSTYDKEQRFQHKNKNGFKVNHLVHVGSFLFYKIWKIQICKLMESKLIMKLLKNY